MDHKSLALIAAMSAIALAPTIASAQSPTYFGGTGGNVPDNNAAGISSTINVSDNFAMTDLRSVTIIGLQHTFLGDLIVTLSHSGRTVDILDRVQGDGDASTGDSSNLSGFYRFFATGGANFNAAAAAVGDDGVVAGGVYVPVPVGNTAPVGGVSPANGSLNDFAGQNVNGAWTLNLSDRNNGNIGSFTGWQFMVTRSHVISRNYTISDDLYGAFPTVEVGRFRGVDVTLAAGATVQELQAFQQSRVFMNGGTANSLLARGAAKLYVNAGTVSGAVTVSETGTAFISGGTVGSVVVADDANAYVLAGTFGSVSASGTSDVFVYGGGSANAVFGAAGGASISLFGDNLALDAASKMAGTDGAGNLGNFYNLSGTLTDGTSLVGTRFFDADGGLSVGGNGAAASNLFFNSAAVTVVPEMGTAWLALAGVATFGIGVVRRKK